jgi:hypothetical protein
VSGEVITHQGLEFTPLIFEMNSNYFLFEGLSSTNQQGWSTNLKALSLHLIEITASRNLNGRPWSHMHGSGTLMTQGHKDTVFSSIAELLTK